ncbi:MAG: cellobiose phosphorylase, partial [Methylocella sp.]
MVSSGKRNWATPRDNNLGLHGIGNRAGLSISVLPNGCIFAIEHRREDGTTMINQLLGSPIDGGIARLYLRIGGAAPISVEAAGSGANARFGAAADSFIWEGETSGLRHRVTLSLHPRDAAWLWRLEATNIGEAARTIDAILIQDIGLGDRGFLMNSEAYASQYIDHHIARHERYGPVVMSRQNLPQGGRNPWV